MKTIKKVIVILVMMVTGIINIKGQDVGSLDQSFMPNVYGSVTSIIPYSNGKVLVGGFGLSRFNFDGSLDSSFKSDIYSNIIQMDTLSNGNIVFNSANTDLYSITKNGDSVLFHKKMIIRKLITKGDSLFVAWADNSANHISILDTNGNFINSNLTSFTNDDIRCLYIQKDGKLLVTSNKGIFRFNVNGSKDTTFNTGGLFSNFEVIRAIGIQSDGKIIIGGTFTLTGKTQPSYIARLNENGTIDNTFSTTSINAQILSIKIQKDNKILVGGFFSNPNRIVRLNSNGTKDIGFKVGTGTGDNGVVNFITTDKGGNVLISGSFATVQGISMPKIARLFGDKILKASICIVSVDSLFKKNVIVWEKTSGLKIKQYNIYKESSQAGIYNLLDSVKFNNDAVFIDQTSNPDVRSDKYLITVTDSFGVSSPLNTDNVFRTINLQSSLSSTPGVINLAWNAFIGFSFPSYFIYRITSTGLDLIDSVSNSNLSYNDNAGNNLYSYIVSVRKINGCDPNAIISGKTNGVNYGSSLSNIKQSPCVSPHVVISGNNSICLGNSTTISASGANSYSWSPSVGLNITTGSSVKTNSILSITYTVVGSVGTCSSSALISIVLNANPDKPTISLNYDTIISSSNINNQWILNDTIIKNSIEKKYVVTNNGIYKVIVTNNNGCSSTSADFNYNSTGIDESTFANNFNIYPNPTNGLVHVNYSINGNSLATVEIYSIVGKKVKSYILNTNNVNFTFDSNEIGSGIYLIKLINGSNSTTSRLVIIE